MSTFHNGCSCPENFLTIFGTVSSCVLRIDKKTEDRRQKTEDGGRKAEGRRQKTEDRGQRAEGRGQKEEDRRQKTFP
jgi:hypothetical protein